MSAAFFIRRLYLPVALAALATLGPVRTAAQSDGIVTPLGDIARSLRRNRGLPAHTVIDNDNLSQVMDEVESRRLSNASGLLVSFDGVGKNFQVSSPDITCSLSFNAQAAPLLSDSVVPQELPEGELLKLDGPASISGDSLQVAVYNGTAWSLREITVGLTIVRRPSANTARYGPAKLIPASANEAVTAEKRSDVTMLYRLKGTAAPATATVFREPLGVALSPEQEWHWAIVQAKGIPPQ